MKCHRMKSIVMPKGPAGHCTIECVCGWMAAYADNIVIGLHLHADHVDHEREIEERRAEAVH